MMFDQVAYKGFVYFDSIYRELLQVVERGKTGSKIINRNTYAAFAQPPHFIDHTRVVMQQKIFCYFNIHNMRREVVPVQGGDNPVNHIVVVKLLRGNIDRDTEIIQSHAAPADKMTA